jgi:hypothetical protein
MSRPLPGAQSLDKRNTGLPETSTPSRVTDNAADEPKILSPFKFFQEGYDDDAERSKTNLASEFAGFNLTILSQAVEFEGRVDMSDLKKAKYINPNKRRKVSATDFEKKVEESNLILLDLLVSCKTQTTVMECLDDQVRYCFEIMKTFDDGRGFLYYALKRSFGEVVKKILSLNKGTVGLKDKYGKTALHYAAAWGHFDMVKLLVESGSDIFLGDRDGQTPLHLALMFSWTDVAVYLLSRGAAPNVSNNYGLNPLDYANRHNYDMLRKMGLTMGPQGAPILPDLAPDTLYRHKCRLYLKLGIISVPNEPTSFPNCYIERDKGRAIKGGKMMDKAVPAEAEDVPRRPPTPDTSPVTTQTHAVTEAIDIFAPEPSLLAAMSTPLSPPVLQEAPLTDTPRTTHRDFTLNDVIGSGSFGEVYLVTSKQNGQIYAMKVYSKQKIVRSGLLKFLFLEKRILINFDHPFIVKVYHTFQTPKKLYLVMDYCKYKDLGQYLTKFERIPEYQARILLAEIILAIEELHRRNIIHRDLKPDNILIDEEGHARLTDFGLSKDGIGKKTLTSTFCGSIAYLPPEVVKREGHGQSADWYLLGELLYECIYGMPPYFNENKKALLQSIIYEEVKFPGYLNRTSRDLINKLMHKDPFQRLGTKGGAKEVKAHPFFTGVDWELVYQRKCKLFDVSEITPYQTQNYQQEIIDKSEGPQAKGHMHKIMNWSLSR